MKYAVLAATVLVVSPSGSGATTTPEKRLERAALLNVIHENCGVDTSDAIADDVIVASIDLKVDLVTAVAMITPIQERIEAGILRNHTMAEFCADMAKLGVR